MLERIKDNIILVLLIVGIAVVVYADGQTSFHAKRVRTDTSNFDNNLSSSDNTVQKALETLDEISGASGSYLNLDQTSPQTIINGVPLLDADISDIDETKEMVNKVYVDFAVASLGARYYMLDTNSGIEDYKLTSTTAPTGSENTIVKSSLSDDDYIAGWISPNANEPDVLLKGIYNWRIYAEKTGGTKTLRLYWKLVERKSDTSETVIATSALSDEITSKGSLIIPLSLTDDYDVSAGSYVLGKIYADVSGGGSAPEITIYYDGDSDGHWEIPVNLEILNNQYVLKSGDTMTGKLTVNDDIEASGDGIFGSLIRLYGTQGDIYATGSNSDICRGYFLKPGDGSLDFKMGFVGGTSDERVDIGWNEPSDSGPYISFYSTNHPTKPSNFEIAYGTNASAEGEYIIFHRYNDGSEKWGEVFRIDTDEDIHLNPDAMGHVYCFDDVDVADNADGMSSYVCRKAPEGDNYIRTFIDQYQGANIFTDCSYLWLQAGTLDSVGEVVATKDHFYIGHEWLSEGDTPVFRIYGYPASEGYVYLQCQLVDDTYDYFTFTRSSSYSMGINFNLPVKFSDDVTFTDYTKLTGGYFRIADNVNLELGNGVVDVYWDTNSTQDDFLNLTLDTRSTGDTAVVFFNNYLLPNNMSFIDEWDAPTIVFANRLGADTNDFAGVAIGGTTTSDVSSDWYFDFYTLTDAVDGATDATTTEKEPIFRFGSDLTNTTSHSLSGGDVLFSGNIEVDGDAYFDSNIYVTDTATSIYKDGSNNLTFKDTNTGVVPLSDIINTGMNASMLHIAGLVYKNTTTVTVKAGTYGVCNGSYFEVTSDTDVSIASPAGEDFYYLYVDDDASTYPDSPSFVFSTTEPSKTADYSNGKIGWYNGDDRCVGAVFVDSSNVIPEFWSDGVQYWYEDNYKEVVTAGNPNSSWQTAESTAYIPVLASQVRVHFVASDSGAVCFGYTSSYERQTMEDAGGAFYEQLKVMKFIPIGASRDLAWWGEDNDNNAFYLRINGYKVDL